MEKPQDWKIRQYYEQDEVVERMVRTAEYREVAPTYPNGYGRRPDAINFPGDFLDFVEDGAVAFHASVERWRNPLMIDDVDLDQLRRSWDLVIDIDCDHSFDLAKDTAELVVSELRQHGIENVSVKFSGNRGFHIGVRAEAFPERLNGESLTDMYPRLPRGIIDYIREDLEREMTALVKKHGLENKMSTDDGRDPYQVSDIENNWGQRHLFRMPYSLHDGSWLVSKPIDPDSIQEFEKEDAKMENIDFNHGFLEEFEQGEGDNLVIQAMDFIEKQQEQRIERNERRKQNKDFETPDQAIPEEHWPPTIQNILEGLEDGRKRALLILINFMRTVGYSFEEVRSRIWEWNEKNDQALPESYVKSQLEWHSKREEIVPPPNYDSNGYYKDMQVYEGDNLEEQVKNPVVYAFRKSGQGREEDSSDEDVVGECPYCGKEYKRESYLKKHVRQCQGDDVEKVS